MTATAPRFGPSCPVRVLLSVTVLVGTLLGALLAGASPASAHAALTGSNPKDGAVVATAPKEVTLTFSEQIAMGDDSIRVLEPSGKRADTAEVRDLGTGGTVVYGVALHSGLPDGTYTVAWQAVSADSHPVSGAFTFSIGAPSKTEVALPEEEAGGGVVGFLYDVARYAAYGGFVLLAGGAAFVLLCWQRGATVRPVQRLVVQGWVAMTASTLAMLLLRGPYTGSGKLADVLDLGALPAVLESKTGAALVSRLLLLGAAALFVAVLFGAYAKREDETEKKDLTFGLAIGGTVVAAGIAATWALSEHASTGVQSAVAMPVDVLHLLAVAVWLGGLATLLSVLHRSAPIDRRAVQRFSTAAFASVVVLAATGLYQSWRQVGSWSALTGTRYGQLLLIKVALVAVMVGVAWVSRRWTGQLSEVTEIAPEREKETTAGSGESADASTDPKRAAQLARQRAAVATAERKRNRDADNERSGLRRSVVAETAVAVILLAVTTMLTSTEPGRTEEAAAEAGNSQAAARPAGPTEIELPFDTGGEKGKGTVRLSLDPALSGGNDMHLWTESPDGKPLDAPEVKVSFTLKAKQIGPLPITPDRLTAGHWTASAVQIPMPGDWTVKVTVRTSDIDQTTIDKNIKIG
ncbi:copper resistance CopC/CopD family protein [Streptomyces xantholiticus]|uniref:copper resistance CopC/CopD family protein n=1 Tax=Streptomyces xantholiticus TaxID=68285 RepID=UPI00167B0A64|nr:copper resistance protein CopC [Streptomyces xantholiticus]GGW45365.1 transport integral membrane protein [Streptomyces xantholiticus]